MAESMAPSSLRGNRIELLTESTRIGHCRDVNEIMPKIAHMAGFSYAEETNMERQLDMSNSARKRSPTAPNAKTRGGSDVRVLLSLKR